MAGRWPSSPRVDSCCSTVQYVQVTFNNPVRYGKAKELFIAPEGLYTGQVRLPPGAGLCASAFAGFIPSSFAIDGQVRSSSLTAVCPAVHLRRQEGCLDNWQHQADWRDA